MDQIKSHFEKVNNIASKCIIGVEYLDKNLPAFKYATLNSNVIGDINSNNYDYKTGDESHYKFYDVIKKEWFEYSVGNQISVRYYGTDDAMVADTVDLYFLNDKKKIDIINNNVLKNINELITLKDKLSVDILQYIEKYDEEIFDIYYQLLASEIISYNQALFSIIFDITLDEYNFDKINDINKFKEKYVNVISVYYDKAVNHLKEEAIKTSPDNSIEDEREELEMIFSMLASAVEESNDDRTDDDLTDPVDILLEYPPILFPIPEFIDDPKYGNSYTTCKTRIQNYFNSIQLNEELIDITNKDI